MPKPRRRVSRFRHSRRKGPTPRFQVGDQAGEFNVIQYLGYSATAPRGEVRTLSQEHHWYLVRCSCGAEETHTQQQLIDTRRHRACASCIQQIVDLKEAQ